RDDGQVAGARLVRGGHQDPASARVAARRPLTAGTATGRPAASRTAACADRLVGGHVAGGQRDALRMAEVAGAAAEDPAAARIRIAGVIGLVGRAAVPPDPGLGAAPVAAAAGLGSVGVDLGPGQRDRGIVEEDAAALGAAAVTAGASGARRATLPGA